MASWLLPLLGLGEAPAEVPASVDQPTGVISNDSAPSVPEELDKDEVKINYIVLQSIRSSDFLVQYLLLIISLFRFAADDWRRLVLKCNHHQWTKLQ